MAKLTYRGSGVDTDAGDALVERIKPLAKATRRAEVLDDVGGFAGLMRIPSGLKDPVLVSGTDGVGTKLKIAFATNRHSTIGIDLVAMCANDVLTTGADPLFFLDYFATGKLQVGVAESVIAGIADGCKQAGCTLLGGETAELPGFYHDNEYDLAGFCVGVVERERIIDGRTVEANDVVLGIASSGLHSNGYSLVRKALLENAQYTLDGVAPSLGCTLADELLKPTKIYAKVVRSLVATNHVLAMAHITGGGLIGNVPRVLPDHLGVTIDPRSWEVPGIFRLVQSAGNVDELELRRTFNLGIGLVVIVKEQNVDQVISAICSQGEQVYTIGKVMVSNTSPDDYDRRVHFID